MAGTKWVFAVCGAAVALTGCQGKDQTVTETGAAPKPPVTIAESAPPPAPVTSVDLSTPQATLKAFAAAMEKGDVAGVKAVAISDLKADKVLEVVVPTIGAMKKLNDAAVKKFGEEGKTIASDKGQGMDFAKDVDKAKVTVNGDTATAVVNDQKEPTRLKKIDGQWKIDFVSAMGPEAKTEDIGKITPMFAALNKAANEGTADIEAGKFKTAAEAKQNVGMKLMAAMFGGMADAIKDAAKSGGPGLSNPTGGAAPK